MLNKTTSLGMLSPSPPKIAISVSFIGATAGYRCEVKIFEGTSMSFQETPESGRAREVSYIVSIEFSTSA